MTGENCPEHNQTPMSDRLKKSNALLDKLQVLTFFVTSRCNSKCRTCFYWQEINKPVKEELTLPEIAKIAAALPSFSHLLLSGGEPLLRDDLVDIVEIFIHYNQIATVDLPTNGLLPEQAAEFVRKIITQHPAVLLTVGVSLDGLKQTHDNLRRVPGNFEKVFATLEAINEVRYLVAVENGGIEPYLHLFTLTVLTAENCREIPLLVDYVLENADVDGMMFELLRGSPADKSLSLPDLAEFDKIVELSLRVNYKLFSLRCTDAERTLRLAYLKETYRLQRAILKGEKLPLHCQAGIRLAVLEPDGDVRLCELLPPVGNLRENNYDFSPVWLGAKATEQRKWIKRNRGSCTHCVNLGHSIDSDQLSLWRRKLNEWVFTYSYR